MAAANEYAKKKNAELEEMLKARGLPTGGKKAEMVARLEENDAAQASSAPAPAADAVPAASTPAAAPAAPAPAPAPSDGAPAADVASTAAHTTTATSTSATSTGAAASSAPVADAPAKDYTAGIAATEVADELARRKARAARFGTSDAATSAELDKEIARAKRFGLEVGDGGSGQGGSGAAGAVRSLNTALPDEHPRKRGREGAEGTASSGRQAKRVDSRTRDERKGAAPAAPLNEADRVKAEARAKRFSVAS